MIWDLITAAIQVLNTELNDGVTATESLLLMYQPFTHSTQAILQVMVIVSFGFVLTKMGYFTMEKQKVYMIAMTNEERDSCAIV